MSGVTVGTRLEQLEKLQVKLEQEIAQERRRMVTDCRASVRAAVTARVRPTPADVSSLRELGVSALTVRTWARNAGIPVGPRGRVSTILIEAYAEAHPMQRATA